MARRYNQKDHYDEASQMKSTADFPMGIVKLQPSRKKSGETWHSMQVSNTDEGDHDQVFGRLPDPIHLHEQTGTFDGQVVFIGHPNRDVSAHQWSSASFQWVNIGRYTHSCSRIEGSLAPDCVQGYAMPCDLLQSFKVAAHNREKHIVDNGRSQETSNEGLHSSCIETVRPNPSSNAPGSNARSDFVNEDYKQTTSSLHCATRKDHLDDPFVAYTNPYPSNPQPTARSLYHLPGPTVANPHQMNPILNAGVATLRFSDSDNTKPTTQEYAMADGLGRLAPTAQNFRGPFFTDTLPTTSDPTALLSVRISEEEKLSNWFRDGQRPARQQEYAKTLMSAAVSNDRYRAATNFGGGIANQRMKSYENTPAFVRVYETLSEYVEERQSDGGRSYFTRAWKVAPPRAPGRVPDIARSYTY
ncbi:ubiquitin homeostasis lub1 [Pyrenophora seminiperda CCB06]|uniref:Ubiquitin homeostasis lub1 n=1 Tax=Pyrenophora seminiperda CCB06 TaxID=1302712 RepID=A0A3M7MEY2_9PLEO|nr:ubiquitin homeostasis lub1 [Pyrenophora seminiperda CCB06]